MRLSCNGFIMIFETTHYASRLVAAGVSVLRAEMAVAQEIAGLRASMVENADVSGRVFVDGILLEFRARMQADGAVTVGTIFPVS